MKRNIIFSIAGVVIGFFIGFFMANSVGPKPPSSTETGSTARQLDEAQKGGRLPPNHPDIGTTGASAASTSSQAQTAMDEADRNPKDFTAQLKAAAIFYQLQSFDKSALYLNRALAVKPDDPDALTGMGQTKYQLGDYAAATTYFEKVLAKHPEDAETRASLGDAYFQKTPPDYDRAITEYRKALNVNPKQEHALAALADTLIRKGEKAEARQLVERLAAVNPSNSALQSLRSLLGG